MSQTKHLKTVYPILAAGIALCGTVALFFGLLGLWLCSCLAANVFLAAGVVCGTEVRPFRKKNPMAEIAEDEPEEIEGHVFRVPMLSVLGALLAAVAAGLISGSAITALLVLFTWGGLGFPLAMCILYRTDFGLSLQTGLITSTVLTAIGGAVQVFLSTPDHSFDLKYCLEQISTRMKEAIGTALTEMQTLADGQPISLPNGTNASELLSSIPAEETAGQVTELFLSAVPGLFAIGILAMLCIIWWGTKAALKKDDTVEIKYMGRLDGYVPGRILSPIYLLFFLANLFSEPGSAMQIASMNVVYVVSAVLTFAGFSLVLYIINTRAPSVVARVLLILATVAVSMSSCGGSILLLLGLLSTGRDLRGTFGGGTYL